jgi:hypothetical protein
VTEGESNREMPAKLRAIEVMLSSRVDDPASKLPDGTSMRQVRERLSNDLSARLFDLDDLFSIFVNEASAALEADRDIEQHCRELVDRADIVLVLYNGSAGWASQGLEGICQTELRVALDQAPYKVRVIRLPETRSRKKIDLEFRKFVAGQNVWMSQEVDTYDGVRDEARRALRHAVAEMVHERARLGSRRFASGRGEALRWRRLDFRTRAARMRRATAEALIEARGGRDIGDTSGPCIVELEYDGARLLLRVDAVPAAMSVAAAREMVGQPFLRDQELAESLKDGAVGPVHVVACLAGVTEAQAARQLGFPDAMIVPTDFGIYVADAVQKIQIIFLTHCINTNAVNSTVQNLLDWLRSSAEGDLLVRRAQERAQIVALLSQLSG